MAYGVFPLAVVLGLFRPLGYPAHGHFLLPFHSFPPLVWPSGLPPPPFSFFRHLKFFPEVPSLLLYLCVSVFFPVDALFARLGCFFAFTGSTAPTSVRSFWPGARSAQSTDFLVPLVLGPRRSIIFLSLKDSFFLGTISF